ncbi:hypothetical protein [Niabella sp.]|uniref:hypothetical protein n=1 Tax=Niabella sp. TaxID=1962976 RepID=UPI00262ED390|nr:hypothetical protein [Niabella sp.]
MIDPEQTQNKENELVKPPVIANQFRPYQSLDDRRFEELTASLIDLKIRNTGFDNYDLATLMTGVSDKGRDLALYRNKRQEGIIQCKKYGKSITRLYSGVIWLNIF